jgi:hypothetical protein
MLQTGKPMPCFSFQTRHSSRTESVWLTLPHKYRLPAMYNAGEFVAVAASLAMERAR